jgi:hypothetical protein
MTIHTVEFEKPLINPSHEELKNALREEPARRNIYEKPHTVIPLTPEDTDTEYTLQTFANAEGSCIGVLSILSPDHCQQEAIISKPGMQNMVLSLENMEEVDVLIDTKHPMYKIETLRRQPEGDEINLHAVIYYQPNGIEVEG